MKQLIDKRNATHRRYKRTGRAELLDEFLQLSNEVDVHITQERNSFLHKHLSDALDENKNIWKEMSNLGLLPQRKEDDLHGFKPGELIAHFVGIAVSSLENIEEAMDFILPASEEDFTFKPVNFTDVVLAISHFPSQVRGVDEVPQRVNVKALPTIEKYLVRIFNSSLAQEIFPSFWKQAQVIALKKSAALSTLVGKQWWFWRTSWNSRWARTTTRFWGRGGGGLELHEMS